MPTTRHQRAVNNQPLQWVDLDPWHTNAPPVVDNHPVVEPAENGQPTVQRPNAPPAVEDHPVVEPANDGLPLLQEQTPTRPSPPPSPLTPLPPTPQREMSPTRANGRGEHMSERARSHSIQRISTSRTLPNVAWHPEALEVGTSSRQRPSLEERITEPPTLLRRISDSPSAHLHTNDSAKQPEEYRIMKFETESKLKSDGTNYYLWKDLEETILIGNRWFDHVDGTTVVPNRERDPTRYATWRQIDNLAKGQLSFNIDASLYQELRVGILCAADLWNKVNARFGTENTIKQNKTILDLRSKHIGLAETVKEHVFQLRKLKADCIDSGVLLSDGEWHSITVASFKGHPKWETVAAMGSFIASPETLLLAMEAQDTSPTNAPDQSIVSAIQPLHNALAALNPLASFAARPRISRRSNNRTLCPNCQRGYHTIDKCWAPGGGAIDKRPLGYRIPTDLLGRERAHLAELRRELEQRANTNETAQSATLNQPTRHFMMAAIRGPYPESSAWLIDSGATSHFVNDRSAFETYASIKQSDVGMPNGHSMQVEGTGNVRINVFFDGRSSEILLRDVVHVPNMINNLVSIKKLLRDNVIPEFSLPDKCILTHDDKPIAETHSIGELWELNTVVVSHRAALANTQESIDKPLEVWHRRLSHINGERIKTLAMNGHAHGMSIRTSTEDTHPYNCEPCVLSKMTAMPSPSREPRATKPGDIIHADLEFMGEKSFSGADISLKFIDEYSNYLWVYAISNKDSATILRCWQLLCTEFITQHEMNIKALHTDNGSEFVNSTMDAYNSQNGILHHLTVPYRHEMNGRSERMNRYGSNAVRAMLTDAKLPNVYWAEAYATFAYIHNRAGDSHIRGSTPFEVLHHKVPDLSHVRIFGSAAYIRMPPEKCHKLDHKALRCILLGYRDDAAYRLIDPCTRQIHYSCDVIFDEDKSFSAPRDPSLPNEIYLEHELDGYPLLPKLSTPIKAVRRSNRPHKPTARSITSHEQEKTLRYLDTPPGLSESINSATLLRFVQGVPVPQSLEDALKSNQATEWINAMQYKDKKLTDMGCWKVVERPSAVHVIRGRWVYNIKEHADGSLEYRARWVARGDTQIPGLEFNETFAASGDFITAKLVIAFSANPSSSLVTIDITSAYLNSPLSDEETMHALIKDRCDTAGST